MSANLSDATKKRVTGALLQVVLLAFLWRSGVAQALESFPPGIEQKINQGVQALKSGDLDSAESIFSDALHHGVKHAILYHNLGVIATLRGKHSEAVARFRQSLALQPSFAPSRLLLGSSLLALRKNAEALMELQRAATLLPNEPQVHLELGRAYIGLENWLGAVREFRILVQLAPQEPEFSYQLGNAWAKLSDWSFRQIITLDPKSARLSQGLGMEYSEHGKYEEALAAYRQAVQANPKLPEVHLALGLIFLNMHKYDEALAEIENELKLVPDSMAAAVAKEKIERAKAGTSP